MAAAAAGGGDGLDAFGGGDMAEALQAMAGALGGEGGGLNAEALLKGMDPANNPLLKGMAEANPELKELLRNPEALKGQMEQMAQLMQSGEGQEFAKKMMTEMQSVLTDPEKLKEGLAQLSSNPALKGLADAVPGLRDVLDNPEALEEQASKTAELFQSMQDPEKMQEMLASLTEGEGGEQLAKLQEMMGSLTGEDGAPDLAGLQQKMLEMMGGLGGDGEGAEAGTEMLQKLMGGMGGLGDLGGDLGGDDDATGDASGGDLKARVREQLAAMMQNQGSGAGELDEEF